MLSVLFTVATVLMSGDFPVYRLPFLQRDSVECKLFLYFKFKEIAVQSKEAPDAKFARKPLACQESNKRQQFLISV